MAPFGIEAPFRTARIITVLKRLLLGIVLAITFLGCPSMAVEEPAFKTVVRDGAFEVRDYPSLIVAEVTVSGDQKEAASKGFRLLAGYIFGGNKLGQSIAMTAPVAQEPVNEIIANTAPVTQIENAGSWVVRFTMPSSYSIKTLPEPNDSKVQLRRLPATRAAVLRFSGLAGQRDFDTKSKELVAATKNHHLRTIGPITLAQYNPPWTLWFMRRNEVMISVEENP
jgi:hypothetical protein